MREAAVERLAKRLHGEMEHLDPTGNDWQDLGELEKEWFLHCIKTLLLDRQALAEALEVQLPPHT